jgi:hypothetical protein
MRPALRVAGAVMAVNAAAFVAGRWYAARASTGDELSPEFARTTVWGGLEFSSRAPALTSGSVTVVGGGAVVDLRAATLDPGGCLLRMNVTFGGATVLVGSNWRVVVDEVSTMSGVAVNVTDAARLPTDTPTLRIAARARWSGIAIRARPSE